MLVPVVVAPATASATTLHHNAYGHKKLMATSSNSVVGGLGIAGAGYTTLAKPQPLLNQHHSRHLQQQYCGSNTSGIGSTCSGATTSSSGGSGSSVIVGVGVGVAAAVAAATAPAEPAAYASVAVVKANSTKGNSSNSIRQPNKRKFSTFF